MNQTNRTDPIIDNMPDMFTSWRELEKYIRLFKLCPEDIPIYSPIIESRISNPSLYKRYLKVVEGNNWNFEHAIDSHKPSPKGNKQKNKQNSSKKNSEGDIYTNYEYGLSDW